MLFKFIVVSLPHVSNLFDCFILLNLKFFEQSIEHIKLNQVSNHQVFYEIIGQSLFNRISAFWPSDQSSFFFLIKILLILVWFASQWVAFQKNQHYEINRSVFVILFYLIYSFLPYGRKKKKNLLINLK
jgi:hypothetical protein